MTQKRIIILSIIAGLVGVLLLIFLGSSLFFLILAGALFYIAYKFNGQLWVQRILIGFGSLSFLIWIGSSIGPVVNNFKELWKSVFTIPFGILTPLIILLGIWIWKRGTGIFFWRLILCAFLLMSWIGTNSSIFFNGYAAFKQNIPKDSIPFVKDATKDKFADAVGKKIIAIVSKVDSSADRDIVGARRSSQTQKTWGLPVGKAVYDNLGNGNFVPRTDLPYTEVVRVFSLGESFTTDGGATYEKCGAPDPVTKQPGKYVVWIFIGDMEEISPTTGHILSSDSGDGGKEKKTTPQKTETSSTPTQHMSWDEFLSRRGVL